MNVWDDIQTVFNNREIALILWLVVIVLTLLLSKLRKSLVPIIKILTKRLFLIIFILIGAYFLGIILFLKYLGIWEIANLKDVLFWLLSIGIILVFKINDVENAGFFKGIAICKT